MEKYRRAVETALTKRAEIACFLSEDWGGGWDDTVKKCRDRVRGSTGFYLLLGHYYGSVIEPSGKSYTHLEFDCARELWAHLPYPPMSVFAAKLETDADNELRAEAAKFIPVDPAERELHGKKMDAFRSEALKAGRTVREYATLEELREWAIAGCRRLQGQTPLQEALYCQRPPTRHGPTDAELGSLGRKPQVDTLDDIMAQLNAEPDEPAAAILVHGDEDAGQRLFLAHLAQSGRFSGFHPAKPGYPPIDPYDIAVLAQWVGNALGVANPAQVHDARSLADALAVELRTQPLYFLLDRVQRLAGGIVAFVAQFWELLRARLIEIHKHTELPNRLLAVVADYKGDLSGREQVISDPAAPNFSKLVALPRLTDFNAADVLRWLNEMNTPDRPPGRRKQLAASVLKNSAGAPDPKPLRAFERLRSENLFQD
jgi:hypothetical protein